MYFKIHVIDYWFFGYHFLLLSFLILSKALAASQFLHHGQLASIPHHHHHSSLANGENCFAPKTHNYHNYKCKNLHSDYQLLTLNNSSSNNNSIASNSPNGGISTVNCSKSNFFCLNSISIYSFTFQLNLPIIIILITTKHKTKN